MTHALLLIDLAFGDCGKGTIADFLTRHYAADTVVRFNGGPQAAHNVVAPDGRHHTFAQFGSGTFVPGVRTVLSRFMLVEPYALFNEARHLSEIGVPDALNRLTIDPRCPIVTPAHQAANRLRELARGHAAHGTCGMGIGETMEDLVDAGAASLDGIGRAQEASPPPNWTLRACDLGDEALVRDVLVALCHRKATQLADVIQCLAPRHEARFSIDTLINPDWIEAAVECYKALAGRARVTDPAALFHESGAVIFEGAQGVLLDQDVGFHPHTTWSRTTFANADELLAEIGHTGEVSRIGVLRSYFTRHGKGPLVTEDDSLGPVLPEPHNGSTGWSGRFRLGTFDAVAARYAIATAGQIDWLAITHLDRLPLLRPRICNSYSGDAPDDLVRRDGDRIVDMLPPLLPDLVRQGRLTRAMASVQPLYVSAEDASPRGFLSLLERELSRPVGLISFGPDATAKRFVERGQVTSFQSELATATGGGKSD